MFVLASAGIGAGLIIAATLVPVNGGGRGGYVVSIYDSSAPRQLQLFAAEPLGVGLIALGVVVLALIRGGPRGWMGGMLLAFGLQSSLLFLAYLGGATFGNAEYNSFRSGSLLGLAGAALLTLAGATIIVRRSRVSLSGSDSVRT